MFLEWSNSARTFMEKYFVPKLLSTWSMFGYPPSKLCEFMTLNSTRKIPKQYLQIYDWKLCNDKQVRQRVLADWLCMLDCYHTSLQCTSRLPSNTLFLSLFLISSSFSKTDYQTLFVPAAQLQSFFKPFCHQFLLFRDRFRDFFCWLPRNTRFFFTKSSFSETDSDTFLWQLPSNTLFSAFFSHQFLPFWDRFRDFFFCQQPSNTIF